MMTPWAVECTPFQEYCSPYSGAVSRAEVLYVKNCPGHHKRVKADPRQ